MALVPSFIPGGDAINGAVTSFLEGGVVGIETIRNIDYGTNYLWTLDFGDVDGFKPPAPFDNFFPASDLTLNLGIINSHTVELAQSAISFPKNSGFKSIDITFFDDENRTIQQWMSDWINIDILNNGDFISGINDTHRIGFPDRGQDSFGVARLVVPTRTVRIAMLNRIKNEVLSYNYLVYPEGELTFTGSQASEATTFSMKFIIVAELSLPKKEGTGALGILQQTLARFI